LGVISALEQFKGQTDSASDRIIGGRVARSRRERGAKDATPSATVYKGGNGCERMRLIFGVVVAAALAAAVVGGYLLFASQATAPASPTPVEAPERPLPADLRFIDHFEGFDRDLYYYSNRGRDGAHTESYLSEEQIFFTPEGAVIEMRRSDPGSPAPLVSGEFATVERFKYGYFEARMRVPRGNGVITGFFTYIGPWHGVNPAQEIDIEILGRNTRLFYPAWHSGGRSSELITRLPFDAADDFHTYGFEWTADALRWYVDGRQVQEVTGAPVERMTEAQSLAINLWGTRLLSGWAGSIDHEQGPWRLTIACLASADTYPGYLLCPTD
jgi:endo-1,3-1,4-beta-glycanase ExoK